MLTNFFLGGGEGVAQAPPVPPQVMIDTVDCSLADPGGEGVLDIFLDRAMWPGCIKPDPA